MTIRKKIQSLCLVATSLVAIFSSSPAIAQTDEVPLFITIGQSNADGSAFFDSEIDSLMQHWYSSPSNPSKMKIWYRSTQVENQPANAIGEPARWVFDGATTDVEPGWLDLWYRNENNLGRTAMNMIHGYGSYSTGQGTDCAQGRRGMEGAFGKNFQTAFPDSELYMIKLGVSGSYISSWANPADDHNWNYFFTYIYRPAIEDILSRGKRPRLAGVWWMQGCADSESSKEHYQECLERLVNRIENDLGFPGAHIYIGLIVKPCESVVTPTGSESYSQNVRDAQKAVAANHDNLTLIDTRNFPMQYESGFNGYIHFNHQGVNAIGEELSKRVIDTQPNGWILYTTPGEWRQLGSEAKFVPSVGNPDIKYNLNGTTVTATLTYPGFTETKSYTLIDQSQNVDQN